MLHNDLIDKIYNYCDAWDNNSIGFWQWDIINNNIKWSNEIIKLFENSSDKLENHFDSFLSFVYPDDRDILKKKFYSSFENNINSFEFIFRASANENQYKFLKIKANNEFINDKISKSNGVILDVTKCLQKECELKKYYKKFTDNHIDSLIVVDLEGKIIFSNDAAINLFGYEYNEFINKNIKYFFNSEYFNEISSNLNKLKSEEGSKHYFQAKITTKQKEIKEIEISYSLLKDKNKDDSIIIIARVTSEKLQLENKNEPIKRKYQYIFEKSPTGIFVYDKNLKIQFFNDKFAHILNIDRDILSDFDMNTIIDKSVLNCLLTPINLKIDGFYEGWYHTTLSDILLYISISTTPYLDFNGNLIGGLGIVNDLTPLKKASDAKIEMERKLQHAQRLETIGVLAGGIAHDFNNILMAILGNSEIAMMKLNQNSSQAKDNLLKIQRATEKAADLCKQLLAYAGKGNYNITHIDLNKLINEMLYVFEISINKKITIKFNLNKTIPLILADSTQINQIFMNLITNASEAIGDKTGIITISTGTLECDRAYLKTTFVGEDIPDGKYTFFEVSDNGCGMDEETKIKMFDPFFTTKFLGRGLGMSAVLGIARSHNGSIKVYTEKNKGTTIKVLFPALEEYPLSNIISSEKYIDDKQGYTGTVLLIDDDDYVRQTARDQLEYLGLNVILAAHAQEALFIFNEKNKLIDLVILDLVLPEIDGIECYRELKRINSDVKVIIVSGYNVEDIKNNFNGKGVLGFLQKPYSLKELENLIKEVLN